MGAPPADSMFSPSALQHAYLTIWAGDARDPNEAGDGQHGELFARCVDAVNSSLLPATGFWTSVFRGWGD